MHWFAQVVSCIESDRHPSHWCVKILVLRDFIVPSNILVGVGNIGVFLFVGHLWFSCLEGLEC